MDDHELLQEYTRNRSQSAFRDLVDRHARMVYSAAHRMVGDSHLAEDVTQNVFATLVEKATDLSPPQVVAGWLYSTTRHLSMHAVRTEQRRREREQVAVAMQTFDPNTDANRVIEHLEPAMAELADDDRDALVLRYLENLNLREVGAGLGISEDAARMRVNRALERLRTIFGKNGVTVTSVVLTTILTSSTVSAIPTGLSVAIVSTALTTAAGVAVSEATVVTTTWLNSKAVAGLIGAALLGGAGIFFSQHNTTRRLQADNQNLIVQREKLIADYTIALGKAAASSNELERLRKDASELPRLRNEVTQLRRQRDEESQSRLTQSTATPKIGGSAKLFPGKYVTKDQLVFAGYATPEDALQSFEWAMMHGTYEQVAEAIAMSPEMLATSLKDSASRESFVSARKAMAPLFKGMQIVARKTLSDDKVELKVLMEMDDKPVPRSAFLICPMVKIGNDWRAGSGSEYSSVWDENGLIQKYSVD